MANYRSGRINEEVKKELSEIIRYEIKDPRLTAMISITQVDVTKDLKYAKVYISIFGKEEEKETCLNILKSSKGFMRRALGNRIKLRCVPELIIELDNSIEHGMYIDSLIHKIKENK
ncbi:30S ribosome-binding factor RbfA [Clostridium hydrogeniformans]|uniref:30S ribosome-binding factor RbfA n=1 Tax=Clostridium hydrogeniformans TaxID=349933 RepID=UPI00048537FA|nr:30S ribosome-binding factor RbfA [Clostridium hydrogeniformans]